MSKSVIVRSVLAAAVVASVGLAACENKPEPAKKTDTPPAKAPEKK